MLILQKYVRSKTQIIDYALCLGNISNNMKKKKKKKTGLKKAVKFFSVHFNPIDTKDILDNA